MSKNEKAEKLKAYHKGFLDGFDDNDIGIFYETYYKIPYAKGYKDGVKAHCQSIKKRV